MTPDLSDSLWTQIRKEALQNATEEPMLASFLYATILNHERLEDALSFLLAGKLAGPTLGEMVIREVIDEAFAADAAIRKAIRADLEAVKNRDPACRGHSIPLLYFKGYHALQSYRIAHWLWNVGRQALALHFQSQISFAFGVDVHPAARIGSGIFIDHATAVVIGETAVVEDNVSMLHEVTLGGTGKESGDRHPKIRHGVMIGAGAKILGNIEVGEGAKIAAGSVVLKNIPAHCTAAGVPAEIVGRTTCDQPALEMDQELPGVEAPIHQAVH